MPSKLTTDAPNVFQIGASGLDELAVRLLTALAEDPRLRVSELGRRLGVSAPTVRERIGRLEESGVIRGYRLDIDPAAVGLPVAATGSPARTVS